jgi:hypothetical protein
LAELAAAEGLSLRAYLARLAASTLTMFVLVQDATEAVASSHVQVDDVGAAGDRFGCGV